MARRGQTPGATLLTVYGCRTFVAVGSLGHEAQDARTFASWGVDFVERDLCDGQLSSFTVMRDALRATGGSRLAEGGAFGRAAVLERGAVTGSRAKRRRV